MTNLSPTSDKFVTNWWQICHQLATNLYPSSAESADSISIFVSPGWGGKESLLWTKWRLKKSKHNHYFLKPVIFINCCTSNKAYNKTLFLKYQMEEKYIQKYECIYFSFIPFPCFLYFLLFSLINKSYFLKTRYLKQWLSLRDNSQQFNKVTARFVYETFSLFFLFWLGNRKARNTSWESATRLLHDFFMNLTKAQSVYETFLHEIYKHFFAKRHFILANTQTPLFWLLYFILYFLKPDLPLFLIADIFFERFSFPLQKNRVNCYFFVFLLDLASGTATFL